MSCGIRLTNWAQTRPCNVVSKYLCLSFVSEEKTLFSSQLCAQKIHSVTSGISNYTYKQS